MAANAVGIIRVNDFGTAREPVDRVERRFAVAGFDNHKRRAAALIRNIRGPFGAVAGERPAETGYFVDVQAEKITGRFAVDNRHRHQLKSRRQLQETLQLIQARGHDFKIQEN